MAAHRYWRVQVTANNGDTGYCNVGEVEMYTTLGGSDVCTGGTASSSSQQDANFAAAKAFDNNVLTMFAFAPWSSNNPGWLKYDFGAGNDKDIVGVGLTMSQASVPEQQYKDFSLQWSDDDSVGDRLT